VLHTLIRVGFTLRLELLGIQCPDYHETIVILSRKTEDQIFKESESGFANVTTGATKSQPESNAYKGDDNQVRPIAAGNMLRGHGESIGGCIRATNNCVVAMWKTIDNMD